MGELEGMVPEGVRALKEALRVAESSLGSIGDELWELLRGAWLSPVSANRIRQVAEWAGQQGPEINRRLLILERMELDKPELFGGGKPVFVDDSLLAPGAALPLTGGFWDRMGQQLQATFDPNLNSGNPVTEQVKGAVEGVAGLGEMVVKFSPNRMLFDHMGWERNINDLAQAVISGVQDPVGFAKSAMDWDTWASNPDRAFGRLIPDIVAAITSVGASGVVSGGKRVTGALARAAESTRARPPTKPSPLDSGTAGRVDQDVAPLFRGDGRRTARIFENGMTARSPEMSIEEHMTGGNGLIAASESKSVARGFAIKHKGFIYEIDDWGNGTPVKYTGRVKHLLPEQETVFTKIEPEQIRGAWKLGRYDNPDTWIPNPNYVPR
ncbi:scabin-related ADP-ribosyltransferase [Nonomuraea cavernae]|uniref:scabin-related ADP-ribosyltransferase n=1 Tax=Nonomuraea cavernae TaxID=2045107 RepID=UPI0033DD366D